MRTDDAPRTPHGGRRLEEAYFATGANVFLEQGLAKAVEPHGSVELGTLSPRRGGARRRVGFASRGVGNARGMHQGNAKGHTIERMCVRVRWDPENPYAVSFLELLDVFWDCHDPGHAPIDDLHASVVLVTNDEQREAAIRSVEKVSEAFSDEVLTRVESVHEFEFVPAPERLQRRLQRASEDAGSAREGSSCVGSSSEYSPNGSLIESTKSSPQVGALMRVTSAAQWVFDWVKVIIVHLAAYVARNSRR
jgi:peptide methionine sulfoxide reductase MsrA